jgi:probable phosphoglycerate mutase
MELVLIRHALPVRQVSTDGEPADPPLSELGHRQASALVDWLESETIHRVVSSPLVRAVETARPLAASKGLEIEIEPRIAEYDRDSELYIPLEELKEQDYPSWRAFMQGGYEKDRDLDEFRREVVAALDEIVGANPGRRVAVFCHGGVIFLDAHYTSMNRFLAASTGERSVKSLNEAPHLRSL